MPIFQTIKFDIIVTAQIHTNNQNKYKSITNTNATIKSISHVTHINFYHTLYRQHSSSNNVSLAK